MQDSDSGLTPDADTGAIHLVRRGRHVDDPASEQVVLLDRSEGIRRAFQAVLPAGGVKYVVPSGRLRRSISFDGAVLTANLEETGEQTRLYPRVRALGLARDGSPKQLGRIFAAAMHGHLDRQIPRMREIVHGVFVDHLGLRTTADALDSIATHDAAGSAAIHAELRSQLGLEIAWSLDPEPRVSAWVRKLQALIPAAVTQSFNAESETSQFNLTYSAQIIRVRPSRLHVVQRRCQEGLAPAAEVQEVLNRVFAILNPAFGVFGDGSRIWQYRNFWRMVEAAFEQVVAPTIADEFGYEVSFQDFRRERTPSEKVVLSLLEDRERLTREYKEAESFLLATQRKEREVIVENDYRLDEEEVVQVRDAVVWAREAMEDAKAKMEASSRGRASSLGPEDSENARRLLKAFHDRLQLEQPELLQLEDAGLREDDDEATSERG